MLHIFTTKQELGAYMVALAQASQTENKDIKISGKKTLDSKLNEEKNIFDNIVTNIVLEGENKDEGSFLLSKLLSLSSDTEKNEKIISDFSKGNILTDNQATHVSIQDLLQVAVILKKGEDPALLPTESKSLKIALSKPEIVKEFKNAKNIKELLDIANKNDIKVKNFQFFQEEAAIEPKDKKIIQKVKSEEIFNLIEKQMKVKNLQELYPLNKTKDFTAPEKSNKNILQSILSKSTSIDEIKHVEQKIAVSDPKVIEEKIVNTKEKIIAKEIKHVEQKIAVSDPKVIEEKTVSTKEKIIDKEIKHVKQKIAISDPKVIEEKTVIKESEIAKEKIIKHIDQKADLFNNKQLHQDNFKNEIKNSNTIITNKDIQMESEKTSSSIELDKSSEQNKTISAENKPVNIEKVRQEPEIKKTFNTFAQEFKEKVENYKAPLMKIKMELKPAGLGEVDVTLLSRGNNLQVNINSNTNTIAMFMQNQAEFKNSLLNMGFSDLQMNFSEQQKKEQGQQKNSKNAFKQFEEEQNEQDGFEMTIPQYI